MHFGVADGNQNEEIAFDEVDDVLSDVEQWICGSIFSERGIQCSTHRRSGQVVFAG